MPHDGAMRTHGAGIRGIETRSIDWIPDTERHGKAWHQVTLWFLSTFSFFVIAVGFIGPSLGLSLGWTIVAGRQTGSRPILRSAAGICPRATYARMVEGPTCR